MADTSFSPIATAGNEDSNTTITVPQLQLPSFVASESSMAACTSEERRNSATAAEPATQPSSSSSISSDSSIAATNEDANNKNTGTEPTPQPAYTEKRKGRCHQCRQDTRNFTASCKNLKGNHKICVLAYCRPCLFDRYGEKVEEVAELEDWACPKCRSICNCSCCMDRKGRKSTGPLTKEAKKNGFASVHHLLMAAELMAVESGFGFDDLISILRSSPASKKGSLDPNADDKENHHDKKKSSSRKNKRESGNLDVEARQPKVPKLKQQAVDDAERGIDNLSDGALPLPKVRKPRKHVIENSIEPNLALPQGTPLRFVAGVEFLEDDDVGEALQFLEFCNTFYQVLGINEGEAESLLQELTSENVELPRSSIPLIVQFHTKLLAIIQEDMGEEPLICSPRMENYWLQGLEKCIRFSQRAFKELPLDCPIRGPLKYVDLNISTRLKLLNLLCDETLCTEKLRTWIDHKHSLFQQRKRELKQQARAAKKRATDAKQKLKNAFDVAKYMVSSRDGAPLSASDHDNLISKLKCEAEEAKAYMESINLLQKSCAHQGWRITGQGKRELKQQARVIRKRATNAKQKLKNEYDVAKYMFSSRDGAPLLVSDHYNLISKLNCEVEEAMESINLLRKKEKSMLFPWPSTPILLEESGHAYWKLKSYFNSSNILLQDIKKEELTAIQDKWFVYDEEDEKLIEKHVST